MGFGRGASFDSFPSMLGYADALKHYNKVTPIRGTNNARPIGKRSDWNRCQMFKDDDGAIRFRLHATDVVTMYPNNTVRIIPWASDTTASFVASLLWSFSAGNNDTNGMYVTIGASGADYVPERTGIFFDLSDTRPKYLRGAKVEFEYSLLPKQGAQARKCVAPLVEAVEVLLRIGAAPTKHYVEPHWELRTTIARLLGGTPVEDLVEEVHTWSTKNKNWKQHIYAEAYGAARSVIRTPVPIGRLANKSPWKAFYVGD